MYSYLTGTIVSRHKDKVILDVGGIGYEIFVSSQTHQNISSKHDKTKIYIYPHYREDNHKLFGFANEEEKSFFTIILTVNGIGPKVALSILSTFATDDLKKILLLEDYSSLMTVPGIGKKGAQRLFLELKDKCALLSEKEENQIIHHPSLESDIIQALLSLGYKEKQARQVFLTVQKKWKSDLWSFENVIRACLSKISV